MSKYQDLDHDDNPLAIVLGQIEDEDDLKAQEQPLLGARKLSGPNMNKEPSGKDRALAVTVMQQLVKKLSRQL